MFKFFKNIVKWIRGAKLFTSIPKKELSLRGGNDAIIKIIDQFTTRIEVNGVRTAEAALIGKFISDEAEETIDKILEITEKIRTHLTNISLLTDIPEEFKDYVFSGNEEENDFYHNLLETVVIISSDGTISILDMLIFANLIKDYINIIKNNVT